MAVVVNEFEVVPHTGDERRPDARAAERPDTPPRPEDVERLLRARAERAARLEAT